jgi:NTE family protein
VISDLVQKLPEKMRKMPDVDDLAGYGCRTRMHVVRLISPPLAGEDHSKDIDFSASGIRLRWDAGYTDTVKVLAQAPWAGEFDPLEGFILHEAEAGRMTFEG